jgi:hypothetical protein
MEAVTHMMASKSHGADAKSTDGPGRQKFAGVIKQGAFTRKLVDTY